MRAADSVHCPLFSCELSRSSSRLWTWRCGSSSRARGKGTAPEADLWHSAAGLRFTSERVSFTLPGHESSTRQRIASRVAPCLCRAHTRDAASLAMATSVLRERVATCVTGSCWICACIDRDFVYVARPVSRRIASAGAPRLATLGPGLRNGEAGSNAYANVKVGGANEDPFRGMFVFPCPEIFYRYY